MQLYEHQKRFIDRNPRACLLCWGTGTGKTRAAIAWIKHNKLTALVICPKALREQWIRRLADQGIVESSNQEGQGGEGCGVTVVTKEEFRRDWDTIPKHTAVIPDEAHFFSGMKSQMSKALIKYINKHEVDYRLLLTATPYMSTPWNIYRLAQILGHKLHYMSFQKQFFHEIYMGGSKRPILKVKAGIEEELAEIVDKVGDIVDMSDCVDVPDQLFETEHVELHKEQERAVKKLSKEFMQSVVRYTKLHQIENGVLKGDEYNEDQEFKNYKLDRISLLVDENKKTAIICRYNQQIEAIKKHLESCGKPIFIISGQTKDRDSAVSQVEESDEAVVLINAACSEGYELPSVGLCIFASLSFSYKDYKQMVGRFLRINKLKKNVYIHLVTKGEIDEAVYQSMLKKQDFSLAIYDKSV